MQYSRSSATPQLDLLPLETLELILSKLDPTSYLSLFMVNKGIYFAFRDNVRFWRRLVLKLGLVPVESLEERMGITTPTYKKAFQEWKTGSLTPYIYKNPPGLVVECLQGLTIGVTPYISSACGEYIRLGSQEALLVEDEGLEAFRVMNIETKSLHILSHPTTRSYTSCQGWQKKKLILNSSES